MACDHLDPKTFDARMSNLKNYNNFIYKEWQDNLKAAMRELYEAWQSSKGWNKINTLYNTTKNTLETAGNRVEKNYTTMKTGGEAYMKSQDINRTIDSIDYHSYICSTKKWNDDDEIIIDEEKISSAAQKLSKSYKNIVTYATNAKSILETDQKFGYYSTGEDNPRLTLYNAYKSLVENLDGALDKFSQDLSTTIAEDKAAREAQKTASTVDALDFSDIVAGEESSTENQTTTTTTATDTPSGSNDITVDSSLPEGFVGNSNGVDTSRIAATEQDAINGNFIPEDQVYVDYFNAEGVTVRESENGGYIISRDGVDIGWTDAYNGAEN